MKISSILIGTSLFFTACSSIPPQAADIKPRAITRKIASAPTGALWDIHFSGIMSPWIDVSGTTEKFDPADAESVRDAKIEQSFNSCDQSLKKAVFKLQEKGFTVLHSTECAQQMSNTHVDEPKPHDELFNTSTARIYFIK